jgi:hypothetical protein
VPPKKKKKEKRKKEKRGRWNKTRSLASDLTLSYPSTFPGNNYRETL